MALRQGRFAQRRSFPEGGLCRSSRCKSKVVRIGLAADVCHRPGWSAVEDFRVAATAERRTVKTASLGDGTAQAGLVQVHDAIAALQRARLHRRVLERGRIHPGARVLKFDGLVVEATAHQARLGIRASSVLLTGRVATGRGRRVGVGVAEDAARSG